MQGKQRNNGRRLTVRSSVRPRCYSTLRPHSIIIHSGLGPSSNDHMHDALMQCNQLPRCRFQRPEEEKSAPVTVNEGIFFTFYPMYLLPKASMPSHIAEGTMQWIDFPMIRSTFFTHEGTKATNAVMSPCLSVCLGGKRVEWNWIERTKAEGRKMVFAGQAPPGPNRQARSESNAESVTRPANKKDAAGVILIKFFSWKRDNNKEGCCLLSSSRRCCAARTQKIRGGKSFLCPARCVCGTRAGRRARSRPPTSSIADILWRRETISSSSFVRLKKKFGFFIESTQ